MPSHEHLRRALLVTLRSPERVKAYLQWALKRIAVDQLLLPETLRRFEVQHPQFPAPRAIESGPANKGLYVKTYSCLFDHTAFTAYKVKGSTATGDTSGAPDEARDRLSLLFSVQICPQCFFASADKNHFAFESPDPDKANLVPSDRQTRLLTERFGEREALARESGSTLFGESRTPRDGLAANRLAVLCAQSLYEGDPRHDPLLLRAIGRCQLSAGHLCRIADDHAGADTHRREALGTLKNAYSALQGAPAHETLYTIVRLAADLGDPAVVHEYGTEARRHYDGRLRVEDPRERISLDKHLKKINAVYEEFFARRGEERHIMNI